MKNISLQKNISNNINRNSLELANLTKQKYNNNSLVSLSSRTQSFGLSGSEVNDFQDRSNQVCQNWLKAHETESLCKKSIQQYTKIAILLQDIVDLIREIETKIQLVQLQKKETSQTVDSIFLL